MSPANWPKEERERVEKIESQTWSPLEAQSVEGTGGIISATVSPISVYAGIQALKHGGNAADAAGTTALTQVTTQLGSVVSYAGIFTMLYYEAKTHQVHSLDAGYNSYLKENDPNSIPVSDLGPLPVSSARAPASGGAKGRETLVPGFTAGVEAMHKRFGRMPFRDLFAPAFWYAGNGVRVSPALQYFFTMRSRFLSRTPEGQSFLRQAGGEIPKVGGLFVQSQLASVLKAIGEHGSQYMYTGRWGQDFLRIVQREGGKVTADDMLRYAPTWSEPHSRMVFGHNVYVNGPPTTGADRLFAGLNLAESMHLEKKGPYWTDPETFQALARAGESADKAPNHSNAIVAMDAEGNIAVVTHTINAVIWGDTGIVVDGIPIPDSAGFQQSTLGRLKPGDRVPNNIVDTIAFEGGVPVLATASIGSNLMRESIRVLFSVLGQHQDLAMVMAAPPLLGELDIPQGAYQADFIAKLRAVGLNVREIPAARARALRGTLSIVSMDPKTGRRMAVNQPGVMVFSSVQ